MKLTHNVILVSDVQYSEATSLYYVVLTTSAATSLFKTKIYYLLAVHHLHIKCKRSA